MTMGEQARILLSRLPGAQPLEVETLLAGSLRDLYSREKWLFLLTDAKIVTWAPYSTGTVSVTAGSTAVTLSGGTWDATWTLRRVVIGAQQEPYNITFTNGTTGVLDSNWPHDTASGLTYTVYQDLYFLPTNCNWGKDSFWWDASRTSQVYIVGTSDMKHRKAAVAGQTGTPTAISRAQLYRPVATVEPMSVVELGPYAPDSVTVISGFYFARPAMPASDADFPIWPEEFDDLIWRNAEIEWSNNPRHRIGLDAGHVNRFWARFFECTKRNSGGAEVERRISTFMGAGARVPLSNFNNASGISPYVMGM